MIPRWIARLSALLLLAAGLAGCGYNDIQRSDETGSTLMPSVLMRNGYSFVP